MVTLRTVRLHGEQRDFTWEARAHRGQRDRAAYGETVLWTARLHCTQQNSTVNSEALLWTQNASRGDEPKDVKSVAPYLP